MNEQKLIPSPGNRRRLGRRGQGAILVELLIVFPVLLLFIVGIVELGAFLWQLQNLSDATRFGARSAAFKYDAAETVDCADVKEVAQKEANRYLEDAIHGPTGLWKITNDDVVVSRIGTVPIYPHMITVTVRATRGVGTANCLFCLNTFIRQIADVSSTFMVTATAPGYGPTLVNCP